MQRQDDRELWQAVGAALRRQRPQPTQPDAMVLAAWMDGDLDEGQAAIVEAWIAQDPDAPQLVSAARSALAAPSPASQRSVLRARALVAPSRSRGQLHGLRRAAAMAASLVFAVAAAFGGFELGRSTSAAVAQTEQAMSRSLLVDAGPLAPFEP